MLEELFAATHISFISGEWLRKRAPYSIFRISRDLQGFLTHCRD